MLQKADDLLVNNPADQKDIDWITERIPHVRAWCERGVPGRLSDHVDSSECASESCSDYRKEVAGKLWDDGVRPPLRATERFFKKIPPQANTVVELPTPPGPGETDTSESPEVGS